MYLESTEKLPLNKHEIKEERSMASSDSALGIPVNVIMTMLLQESLLSSLFQVLLFKAVWFDSKVINISK